MQATTQFMVDSPYSSASSVASFDEDLALTEQQDYDGLAKFDEGKDLLGDGNHGIAATDLFQLIDNIMSNYKPVFKPDQVVAFPWLRSDDDINDAGGPRAGPVQVPDGPLHAALDLPELEDSLGSTDTLDKFGWTRCRS